MNDMNDDRNILGQNLRVAELGTRKLRNSKLYMMLLVLVMIVGISSLSTGFSSITNNVVVESKGIISISDITAESGSARDIQKAVDWVAAHCGIGNVHIPDGTFNFVEIGEPWMTVNIPLGVNLFGAPTERNAGGQVVGWKTVLVMPYEAPNEVTWFSIQGNGSSNISFRFSDIKLVGWRFYNQSSKTMSTGINIYEVLNFRVDHCHFQDIAESGISAGSAMMSYNRKPISGVIDHCRLVNTYGDPGFMAYENRTIGYGIGLRRWACDVWDYDVTSIWGHYNNYTVFIEDNYFSKWRHCVSSNDGIHYVFRYNTVENSYGIGEVDGHGSYADNSHPYAVGTRCIEAYNNVFKNPDTTWYLYPWAFNIRGGTWVAFNNTLIGYYALCDLNDDYGNYEPYCPQCHTNQTYIWNNTLNEASLVKYNRDCIENVHYFLREPNLAQDGFEYTPYLYPHPLTLEESES